MYSTPEKGHPWFIAFEERVRKTFEGQRMPFDEDGYTIKNVYCDIEHSENHTIKIVCNIFYNNASWSKNYTLAYGVIGNIIGNCGAFQIGVLHSEHLKEIKKAFNLDITELIYDSMMEFKDERGYTYVLATLNYGQKDQVKFLLSKGWEVIDKWVNYRSASTLYTLRYNKPSSNHANEIIRLSPDIVLEETSQDF